MMVLPKSSVGIHQLTNLWSKLVTLKNSISPCSILTEKIKWLQERHWRFGREVRFLDLLTDIFTVDVVLSRFSSGLFRAMFAMKEIENGKEERRVPPRRG